jgi:intracellular septation protein
VGVGLLLERKIAWLPLILGLVPTLTGILSLFFDDSRILKAAMTAPRLLLGVLMLGGLALGANPLKNMFGDSVDLPDDVWWQLAIRFGLLPWLSCWAMKSSGTPSEAGVADWAGGRALQ